MCITSLRCSSSTLPNTQRSLFRNRASFPEPPQAISSDDLRLGRFAKQVGLSSASHGNLKRNSVNGQMARYETDSCSLKPAELEGSLAFQLLDALLDLFSGQDAFFR